MFIGFILTRAENAASPAPADGGAKTVSREARCAVPGLADIRPYEDGEGSKGSSRSARQASRCGPNPVHAQPEGRPARR